MRTPVDGQELGATTPEHCITDCEITVIFEQLDEPTDKLSINAWEKLDPSIRNEYRREPFDGRTNTGDMLDMVGTAVEYPTDSVEI